MKLAAVAAAKEVAKEGEAFTAWWPDAKETCKWQGKQKKIEEILHFIYTKKTIWTLRLQVTVG